MDANRWTSRARLCAAQVVLAVLLSSCAYLAGASEQAVRSIEPTATRGPSAQASVAVIASPSGSPAVDLTTSPGVKATASPEPPSSAAPEATARGSPNPCKPLPMQSPSPFQVFDLTGSVPMPQDWGYGGGAVADGGLFAEEDGGKPTSDGRFAELYVFVHPVPGAGATAMPTARALATTTVAFADGVARPAVVITDDPFADTQVATKGLLVSYPEGTLTIEVGLLTNAECFKAREAQLRSFLALVETPHVGPGQSFANNTPGPAPTPQAATPTPGGS